MQSPSVAHVFDTFYTSLICSKIYGQQKNVNEFGFPNEFIELPLSDILAVVSTVLAVLPSERHTTQSDVISRYSISTAHSILMEAISIFSNWPNNYIGWLSNIQNVIRKPRKKQVELSSLQRHSALMKFTRNVSNNLDSDKCDFIKSVLASFIAESWRGNINLIKAIAIDKNERKFWSGWQIAYEIGIDLKDQKRLIGSNIIIGEITPMENGQNSIKIDVSSALEYKERRSASVTLKKAGEILGINERAVLDLIEYKSVVVLRGPIVDGFNKWLIDLQSVLTILDTINKNLLVREIDDELMIPFKYSWMVVGGTGYKPSLGRIVAEACSGKLCPCKITNDKGLNKFWFAKDDLKKVFAEEIKEYKQQTLSLIEAARKLQTSKNALRATIEKGMIETEKSNGKYYFIKEDELQKFSKKYISLNEIVKLTSTNSKTMRVYLHNYGVEPLFQNDRVKYLPYIYERSELLQIAIKEFNQKQKCL